MIHEALYHLFTGKPFAFYTSGSVNETLDLLKQHASTPQKSVEASLKLSGHSPYQFNLGYFSRRSDLISVRGKIQATQDGTTMIHGKTHISPKIFIFVFTFLAIWFTYWMINGILLLALLGMLIPILGIVSYMPSQHKYHRKFCELFEKKKKSS